MGIRLATVNELYADAADDSHPSEIMRSIGEGYAMKMPEDVRGLLAGLWGTERFRMGARTLEKYENALRMAEAAGFDRGAQPYQDVALLIQLRNAMIHFEPQSHHEGEDEPTQFEKKQNGAFPLNPLAAPLINPLGKDPLQPFLPHKCLGYGCAMWALESSVAFTKEFFSRMGLKASHGDWLVEMAVEYASLRPLEEIATKHGARAEHLVERPVETPPNPVVEMHQRPWPAELAGAVLRLWRARCHLEELRAEIDGFFDLKPYRTVLYKHEAGLEHVLVVHTTQERPVATISAGLAASVVWKRSQEAGLRSRSALRPPSGRLPDRSAPAVLARSGDACRTNARASEPSPRRPHACH